MLESSPMNKIDRADAMRMGTSYKTEIPLGDGRSITVRPLTIMETMQAAANVVEKMKSMPESWKTRMTEHMYTAREMLKYASTSDVGKNDSSVNDEMLNTMTPDQLQFVYRQFVAVLDKVNPCLEMMKPEELEQLVLELKKNSPEELVSPLTELTFLQAINLVRYFLTRSV